MSDRITRFFASRRGIALAEAVIGVLAPLLQKAGAPPNMGICVACFERNIAGAVGLHRADVVQHNPPEIIAFVLGSTIAAFLFREFRSRAGSTPAIRTFPGGHRTLLAGRLQHAGRSGRRCRRRQAARLRGRIRDRQHAGRLEGARAEVERIQNIYCLPGWRQSG